MLGNASRSKGITGNPWGRMVLSSDGAARRSTGVSGGWDQAHLAADDTTRVTWFDGFFWDMRERGPALALR